MAIQEVRVAVRSSLPDAKGRQTLAEIQRSLHISTVQAVRTAKVFRFEGITVAEAGYLARTLLCEDIFQVYTVNEPIITDTNWLVEVAYRPGVMNPEAGSLIKSARDLGLSHVVAADSSWEYAFYGPEITPDDIDTILRRLLVNATVQHVVREKPETLIITGRSAPTLSIPITGMTDEELMELSKDKLFLNLEEMRLIQDHFRAIGREPTDCEVEILAQTWSEHCVHKTFKAHLTVDGREKRPLLKRLQEATNSINHPLVLSAFVDNSGVLAFYDGWAVCGKVETHNSPSAIEPYGGAATGSGGVFRDVMGTGQGAKVIASTDMFCFAPPDTPLEEIPQGCMHPNYLLRQVVAGVRDYGNRMGIPTNNGSVHFHRDFRAKPTVIVGSYGLLPADRCEKGKPEPGDLVVVIGGRTGRDGIHGATFSSAAMTDRTMDVNAQAVQIGHPIEEKRMSDALLAARDEGLIRAVTDCGAGGFASAVGEMGASTGAVLALDKAPLKYSGLAPWEILLSESQERMVAAVRPSDIDRFREICREHNVEATVLGTFTGDGRFRATYEGAEVMNLSMAFLHGGLPQRRMQAARPPRNPQPELMPDPPADWVKAYKDVMAHLNVCSKEPIVRVYDHGVQGTNALPPLGGVDGSGPNDACVLTPILGKPYGLVIAHGLNPILNRIDPYWGSIWAAAEAVANAVAAGANIDELALIDNFIWPVPDEEMLWALDRAVDACTDFARSLGCPFISGKDSLSSTYRGAGGLTIRIPPVLCVSAFGRIPDVKNTVSADFKKAGSQVLLVGQRDITEMAGSVYWENLGLAGTALPKVDLASFTGTCRALYRAINSGKVLACHDISEGGLAAAIAEMCIGGRCGVAVSVPPDQRPDYFLFNETAGCFIVELAPETAPGDLFGDVPWRVIGSTTADRRVSVSLGEQRFAVLVDELKEAWQRPMKEVFGA
ncbi:phosphoribosylformylglycinamidine synthase subunit PurL [Desulforudis sp. 1088]|uniref:phosphoribosylformylglycinamidine synthase subunit PurL n=2 Tax=Candidatus Desulforudis TaxID=471826 RepID=UPI003CE49E7D